MSVARRRQMIERGHASLSITAQCRLVSIAMPYPAGAA
jgi:putative transposase